MAAQCCAAFRNPRAVFFTHWVMAFTASRPALGRFPKSGLSERAGLSGGREGYRLRAGQMHSRGRLAGDPADAVELYTRQSCVRVSARDLAVMGATLAAGGVNPVTHERVVSSATCRLVLAVMTTAGL